MDIIERWQSEEPYNDAGDLIGDTIAEIKLLQQRAAEAEAHLRALVANIEKPEDFDTWDVAYQAAAKWLEEHGKEA